ncbi:uncharacterized protein LOC126839543 [Adelges cooleyi]|uniref:uncharacterized protein LOC126839543 n=1 Tax=Adelges cooleyi TaxID=133065 RepID=UPI0021801F5B|nr:uncharacterized protein LOC126839543 [Adelges cooleyi]
MKSFVQLFLLLSMILAGLLVSDGLCQIVRRPVNADVEMGDLLRFPHFLKEKVESKLKANNICIEGINVCKIQDMKIRHRAVNLMLEQVAEEVTNLLDWFTDMVIQMVGLIDNSNSLEKLLDDIQSTVFNLNRCLEYLYNYRVNVTQALDRYLFLSDIIFVYRAVPDTDTNTDTPRHNFQKRKILDLIKWKTKNERLPTGARVGPQKSCSNMLVEAKTKISRFTKFYNRRYGFGWLYADQLKWKAPMESVTVQHLVSPVSGKSLRKRYDETAAEVDSTKVIVFYAEVAETIAVRVAQKSFAVYSLFVDYLLAMMHRGSPNDAIRHERLSAVFVVLHRQLNILKSYQHTMISVRRLECPVELLLTAIADFDCVIERGGAVLKYRVWERDLWTVMKSVNPRFLKPSNAPDPAEMQPDIAATENPTTEKLGKIIEDMKAISSETSDISDMIKYEYY